MYRVSHFQEIAFSRALYLKRCSVLCSAHWRVLLYGYSLFRQSFRGVWSLLSVSPIRCNDDSLSYRRQRWQAWMHWAFSLHGKYLKSHSVTCIFPDNPYSFFKSSCIRVEKAVIIALRSVSRTGDFQSQTARAHDDSEQSLCALAEETVTGLCSVGSPAVCHRES